MPPCSWAEFTMKLGFDKFSDALLPFAWLCAGSRPLEFLRFFGGAFSKGLNFGDHRRLTGGVKADDAMNGSNVRHSGLDHSR